MLEGEKAKSAKLAYDRPSPKLLAFLKKHYGLVNYIPQNNNYVVYNQYFSPTPSPDIITLSEKTPPAKSLPLSAEEEKKALAGPAIISKEVYEKLKYGAKGKGTSYALSASSASSASAEETKEIVREQKAFAEDISKVGSKPFLNPAYALSAGKTSSSAYGSYYHSVKH